MSSSTMQITPEEIDTAEKRGKLTVSIIGCGQTGILQATRFAEAGFRVVCADGDQTVVHNISKGKATLKSDLDNELKSHIKTGHLSATDDIKKAVSQGDLVAVTIPVKIDARKKADYSDMEKTCKQIGSSLRRGSLVVVMSLTGIGITEGLIKETLENTSGLKAGTDFGLAYSPFQTSRSQTLEEATSPRRIVAATDKSSLNATSTIIESIGKNRVNKKENIKTAEAAALFEILQRDVDDALANELAIFCEKLGIDYLETHKLVGTNAGSWFSSPEFDLAKVEPYLLLEDAESLNVKLRISAAARETNEEMPKHVINLTKDALRSCGKTLRRARVTLLGVSQTPNTKGSAKRMAREIVEMLETKGARVSLYDPYLSNNELTEMQSHCKRNLPESAEGADCMIIVTGHDQFKRLNLSKLKLVMRMPAAIVDLEGIIEPGKTEKEGFIYRGLGRGVWTR